MRNTWAHAAKATANARFDTISRQNRRRSPRGAARTVLANKQIEHLFRA